MTVRTVAALALSVPLGLAGVSSALVSTPAQAATRHPRPARVTSTRMLAPTSYAARRAVGNARQAPGQALRVLGALQDNTGVTHVRLARTIDGLPIIGGDEVVHQAADGTVLSTDGDTGAIAASVVDTPPSVTAARARELAVDGRPGPATLAVDVVGGQRLVWQVTTRGRQADGSPSVVRNLIDATTGRVISTEQTIETIDGSGQTHWSGRVPLQVTVVGGRYALRNPFRGHTATTDFGNRWDGFSCVQYGTHCLPGALVTSATPVFGNGRLGNRATVAADAQYAADMTWDFYRTTYGRLGIWNTGRGTINRVHYGRRYDNAFWDGARMTYGDGDGVRFGPLVSLDVTGHEMTHGVTENTARLAYTGDAGGLNESTSDVFGTMVEWFANNPADPPDYLIGEQFDLLHHLGLRRMDDPHRDGYSADCWANTAAFHKLDPHYSSGVGNHLFYLLSEGSGAKTINGVAYDSPTCDGSTLTGIGHDKAAAIWYRALTVYMRSYETYPQARSDMLKAATDLYPPSADGVPSPEYTATAAAWSAVGVN